MDTTETFENATESYVSYTFGEQYGYCNNSKEIAESSRSNALFCRLPRYGM